MAPPRSCPEWGCPATARPHRGRTDSSSCLQPRPNPSTPRELGVPPSRNTTARHPLQPGRAHWETLTRGPRGRPQLRLRFPLSRARPAPRAGASALALSTRSGNFLPAAAGPPQTNSPSSEHATRLSAPKIFFFQAPRFPRKSSNLDPVPAGRRFVTARRAEKAGPRYGPWFAARRQELRRLRAGASLRRWAPLREAGAGGTLVGASPGRGRDAAPAHPAPWRFPSLWSSVLR